MDGYSKYDKRVAKAIRELKKPVRYVMDIVDHNDFIEVRVYKNEILAMNAVDQEGVMKHLSDTKFLLDSFDIKSWFNGVDGDPPTRS
jgi:hypothetical protein